MNLHNYAYVPAVRMSLYNLGAIEKLEDTVKDLIIPRVIIRDKEDCLDRFLSKWGEDRPIMLEVSKYDADLSDPLSRKLNDHNNHFENQFNFFDSKKSYQIIPVINEESRQHLRDVMQLSRKLINSFEKIAIKLNMKSDDFQESFQLINTILSAFSDDEINKVTIIIDLGKIETLEDVPQHRLSEVLSFIEEYTFDLVVFSSTSYPATRPASGTTLTVPCLDPYWQYQHINQLEELGVKAIYGDYSATDPSIEVYNFDFAVHPVPYATYLLNNSLEWYTLRDGAGGEYEKFREIAKNIQSHAGYHGDNFCYANQIIADISSGNRDKAGNQAFWNKLKINQHISAIINAHNMDFLNVASSNVDNDIDDEDF